MEDKWEGTGILGEILMAIRKRGSNIIGNNTDQTNIRSMNGDNSNS